MNGSLGPDPSQEGPGADPLAQALAAGGGQPTGAVPEDHTPTYPGTGLEGVSLDDVEQELLRAIRQAGRVAAGSSDATQISAAGTGAQAFVMALDKLNAPDPTPPAPQQVPVMPHAVGIVRHALAADHGVPTDTFDELLAGAHHHLNDLQQAGSPPEEPPAGPAAEQAPSGP